MSRMSIEEMEAEPTAEQIAKWVPRQPEMSAVVEGLGLTKEDWQWLKAEQQYVDKMNKLKREESN